MASETDPLTSFVDPEPEPLWTFAYVSEPTVAFTDEALQRLHLAAQMFNAREELTGRLVVVERDHAVVRFVQVVEGPRDALQACAARIFGDPRHGNISMIQTSRIDARRFSKWSMRYDVEALEDLGGEVAVALWRASSRPDAETASA